MIARYPGVAAVIAGLLSATGFAPLDLWPVTLLCLALLIHLTATAPDRRSAFKRGWLFGVGHFTMGLNWIAHAFTFQDAMPHWFGYGAVALLSLYLAVYPALAALAAWWGAKRLGAAALPLLFAAAWIATEYLRATLFTGFAWNPLGVVLVPTGAAISATVLGSYGASALVILFAAGLWLAAQRHVRAALTLIVPITLIATLGLLWPAPPVPAAAPAIRIVQPNIGQQDKYTPAFEAANYAKLARLSGTPAATPRLIFWPEAAIPAYLDMEPEWRDRLAALLGPDDLLMTGGTKVYFKDKEIAIPGGGSYTDRVLAGANNSLWVIAANSRILGRYNKAHLVPYGEYLPMRNILQPLGLSRLVPGDADFWPGPGPQSLTLPAASGRPPLKMGVQICYEIIFSGQVVDEVHRPDFVFNPSNDAWFGSWGPPQHLAQARLRAIEEGVPIIRSTPTGISAVIDARGRILHSLPHQQPGFIDARLPPSAAPTWFSRTGNAAPLLFAVLLILAAVATCRVRR